MVNSIFIKVQCELGALCLDIFPVKKKAGGTGLNIQGVISVHFNCGRIMRLTFTIDNGPLKFQSARKIYILINIFQEEFFLVGFKPGIACIFLFYYIHCPVFQPAVYRPVKIGVIYKQYRVYPVRRPGQVYCISGSFGIYLVRGIACPFPGYNTAPAIPYFCNWTV